MTQASNNAEMTYLDGVVVVPEDLVVASAAVLGHGTGVKVVWPR